MPVTLRNVSGLGDLDVSGFGLWPLGAEHTVDDDLGASLALQGEHFQVVPAKAAAKKASGSAASITTHPAGSAAAGPSEESA